MCDVLKFCCLKWHKVKPLIYRAPANNNTNQTHKIMSPPAVVVVLFSLNKYNFPSPKRSDSFPPSSNVIHGPISFTIFPLRIRSEFVNLNTSGFSNWVTAFSIYRCHVFVGSSVHCLLFHTNYDQQWIRMCYVRYTTHLYAFSPPETTTETTPSYFTNQEPTTLKLFYSKRY